MVIPALTALLMVLVFSPDSDVGEKPLEIVPQTFKTIALFTPTYWAVHGIQDVMCLGKSWIDVLPDRAVLTAIAIPKFQWD